MSDLTPEIYTGEPYVPIGKLWNKVSVPTSVKSSISILSGIPSLSQSAIFRSFAGSEKIVSPHAKEGVYSLTLNLFAE